MKYTESDKIMQAHKCLESAFTLANRRRLHLYLYFSPKRITNNMMLQRPSCLNFTTSVFQIAYFCPKHCPKSVFTVRSMPKFSVLFMVSEQSEKLSVERWPLCSWLSESYVTNFSSCDMAAGDKYDLVTVNVTALFRCELYVCLCINHHYVRCMSCFQIATVSNVCGICNDLVMLSC